MSTVRFSDFRYKALGLQAQPLVSLVTPVYNGAEHLHESIESVLAQTYQNWEYLIVDNCSTDRTLEIAQSYAARDSRIQIHNNREFLSIIQNHNHSLRQISSQSKYCKLVFADDWLFPECIERMVALAEANPSVGVVGAYGFNGIKVLWHGLPYPTSVVSGRELCRQRLLGGTYVSGTPSALLFRSDLIRKGQTFYDEWNLHADGTVFLRVLQECDFGFIHQILTFIRVREGSNTSFTDSIHSLHLAWLTELIEYGPRCLNERECQERLQARLKDYYKVLAESALQLREKSYWKFHENWLLTLGIPLDRARLFKAICVAAVGRLLHPLHAAKRVVRWWSRVLPRIQTK